MAIKSPNAANADGIFAVILEALNELGLSRQDISQKLVSFASDGASVMSGAANGVAAKMKEVQPNLVFVHCFCHRLELALKDALKGNRFYQKVETVLSGLYTFFHRSPKRRHLLKEIFAQSNETCLFPKRIGGTRWVAHEELAISNLLRGYKCYRACLEKMRTLPGEKVCSFISFVMSSVHVYSAGRCEGQSEWLLETLNHSCLPTAQAFRDKPEQKEGHRKIFRDTYLY